QNPADRLPGRYPTVTRSRCQPLAGTGGLSPWALTSVHTHVHLAQQWGRSPCYARRERVFGVWQHPLRRFAAASPTSSARRALARFPSLIRGSAGNGAQPRGLRHAQFLVEVEIVLCHAPRAEPAFELLAHLGAIKLAQPIDRRDRARLIV